MDILKEKTFNSERQQKKLIISYTKNISRGSMTPGMK